MEYYKLTKPLIINESSTNPIHAEIGQTVYVNSDGTLGICKESEIATLSVKVDAEIAQNVADAEAWKLANPPVEEEPVTKLTE